MEQKFYDEPSDFQPEAGKSNSGPLYTAQPAMGQPYPTDMPADNREDQKPAGNLLGGLVGACLGALLGGALWVLIGQLGYIAGLAGLVMAICALKGFQLLGGKLTVVTVLIVFTIVLITVYFAQRISYSISLYNAWKGDIDWTFFDAYRILPELVDNSPDLKSSFLGDLLIGLVLTVIGSFGAFRNAIAKTQ